MYGMNPKFMQRAAANAAGVRFACLRFGWSLGSCGGHCSCSWQVRLVCSCPRCCSCKMWSISSGCRRLTMQVCLKGGFGQSGSDHRCVGSKAAARGLHQADSCSTACGVSFCFCTHCCSFLWGQRRAQAFPGLLFHLLQSSVQVRIVGQICNVILWLPIRFNPWWAATQGCYFLKWLFSPLDVL